MGVRWYSVGGDLMTFIRGDGDLIEAIAGEDIANRDVCYISTGELGTTAGRAYKAEASSIYSTHAAALGISQASRSTGDIVTLRTLGIQSGLDQATWFSTTWDIGDILYVGSPGLTEIRPQNAVAVGVAISSNEILIRPVLGRPPTTDLTVHAYPWAIRRDKTAAGLEDTFNFLDRQTFVQWSNGWSLAEDLGNISNGTTTVRVGEELDGDSSNRRTSFYQVNQLITEEARTVILDMRLAVPSGFVAWGADGIILRHKIGMLAGGAGASSDSGSVTITVFDPTTATDTSAASATRSRAANVADDTVYQELQITGATLNAITNPLAPGEMLHLRINLGGNFVAGAHYPSFELGRLSTYFA